MSNIENLRRLILCQRDAQPRSSKAPGSSPLNLYVTEIVALRDEGFGYAEIASALYLQHQVRTDERVLSKFMIRYRNRREKQVVPKIVSAMKSTSVALYTSPSQCSGSDGGGVNIVDSVIFSGGGRCDAEVDSQAGSTFVEVFVSSNTKQHNEQKERQLKNKIFNFIESAKPIVREDFKKKHGKYPADFQDDIAFWKTYWGS